MLALSDWSILFPEILRSCELEDRSVSFIDLVKQWMYHSRPAVAAIAAEIAAKLLLAGRICESNLIAQLLYIFFDPTMTGDETSEADEKEVGSPARLQQILSLFFPAYSLKSELGREAMMGSISHLLELANRKSPRKSKKRKAALPMVKMIEFVCSIVDAGREAENSKAENPSTPRNSSVDSGENQSIGSSTALVASVQVSQFLRIEGPDLTTSVLRGLCKFMGNLELNFERDDLEHLKQLKEGMEELGMIITDSTSLRSFVSLNEQLTDFELPEEENSEGTETETEDENDDDDNASDQDEGEELHHGLMDSMCALSIRTNDKENKSQSRPSGGKSSSRRNRSSGGSARTRLSNSSSVLENLGASSTS